MREALTRIGLAGLLTLAGAGCGDKSVSPKEENPQYIPPTREEITEFVRAHYGSREKFPGVDSVRVNDGDVTVYGAFLDNWKNNMPYSEVESDSSVSYVKEIPKRDYIVVDVEPFNGDDRIPTLRLEEGLKFSNSYPIKLNQFLMGTLLSAFYDIFSEKNDGPYVWDSWDFSSIHKDVWTEVSRRINR